MKYLLAPAFAAILSTAGVAYGCHAVGMPTHDLTLATILAGTVSSLAAFGAVFLARGRGRASLRANTERLR